MGQFRQLTISEIQIEWHLILHTTMSWVQRQTEEFLLSVGRSPQKETREPQSTSKLFIDQRKGVMREENIIFIHTRRMLVELGILVLQTRSLIR